MSDVGGLRAEFPDLKVISEEEHDTEKVFDQLAKVVVNESLYFTDEDYDLLPVDELVVWVDPLDGTKELIDGYLHRVTILIGVAWKGKAIAGVIAQPFNVVDGVARTVVDWVPTSKTPQRKRNLFSPENVACKELRVVTSRSHSQNAIVSVEAWCKDNDLLVKWTRMGGCGAKTLDVLEGRSDIYYYPARGTKKWDSCACDAIVKANGGSFTDANGGEINYDASEPVMNERGLKCSIYYANAFASHKF